MTYKIISTGSMGNAVVIGDILIDCGVPFKALGEEYRHLKLVLLTHEHGDHFRPSTIKRLADERPALRFGCCGWMVQKLTDAGVRPHLIDVYNIGARYDYKAFSVSPVKLYHDVPNCGYRLYFGNEKVFYATDTCTLKGIEARGYDLYFVEANYKEDEIKRRIEEKKASGEYAYEIQAAKRHLSMENATEWLYENMTEKSRYIYMHGHLDKSKGT